MSASGHRLLLSRHWDKKRTRATTVSYRHPLDDYFSTASHATPLLVLGEGVMPFSTQFFHEDYDDGPGFDDGFGGDGDGFGSTPAPEEQDQSQDQDLLAATQGLGRKVRPEAVNFAKRAKRVDVRKLKENIWKQLDIVTGHSTEVSPVLIVESFC